VDAAHVEGDELLVAVVVEVDVGGVAGAEVQLGFAAVDGFFDLGGEAAGGVDELGGVDHRADPLRVGGEPLEPVESAPVEGAGFEVDG
jgi:hypothetical protein